METTENEVNKLWDYTERDRKNGVELIVRPGNRYGAAEEGARVLVDPTELKNPSTMSSCMTKAEAAELERKRVEALDAIEATRKKPSRIMAVVEEGLARIAAAAERAAIDAAESKNLRDAEEATQLAERAEEKLGGAQPELFRLSQKVKKAKK